LGIYSRECESVYKRDTCISKCAAALFKIAKLWNQPRCPTTNECIKNRNTHTHTHTHEQHSVIKKNEIMPVARKWMELELIVLTEISQAQKTICCMFSFIYGT
jgi:thiamine pyrophosphate-dependent acetolactate synthase large subunit-like protein